MKPLLISLDNGFHSQRRSPMMIRNSVAAGVIIAVMAGMLFCRATASADAVEVPRISVERAKQMVAAPDVVVIDVRTAKTWWRSPYKITNAIREEPGSVEQWAEKYPKNETLIFYCS